MDLTTLAVVGIALVLAAVIGFQFLTSTTAQDLVCLGVFLIGAWIEVAADAARSQWGWVIFDGVFTVLISALIYRIISQREAQRVEE